MRNNAKQFCIDIMPIVMGTNKQSDIDILISKYGITYCVYCSFAVSALDNNICGKCEIDEIKKKEESIGLFFGILILY